MQILDEKVMRFIFDNCNVSKLNSKHLAELAIDAENVGALSVLADHGVFKQASKRDAIIEYAVNQGKTQASAWLLDYKGKTADQVKENEAAEKKAQKELSGPKAGSVEALKKEWSYKKQDDGTLVLTKYKGSETVVEVPEKIGKALVTTLDGTFFCGFGVPNNIRDQYRKITDVVLPGTIKYIGNCTFKGCVNLIHVVLPDSVCAIGVSAFKNCENLQNITIPNGVVSISEGTFDGCTSLLSVSIPNGVTSIGVNAFRGCVGLSDSNGFIIVNNVLRGYCGKNGIITIPDHAAAIEDWAFASCDAIYEVVIPEGVTNIGEKAFLNCNNLQRISIPDSVNSIGERAFFRCGNLTIHAPAGSYAESYAKENNIPFVAE